MYPNPNPAKPEPKTGPEAQAEGSRGCSEGTERNPRKAKEKDQSPGRGDRTDRPPNVVATVRCLPNGARTFRDRRLMDRVSFAMPPDDSLTVR
jgi:hypothetical protein